MKTLNIAFIGAGTNSAVSMCKLLKDCQGKNFNINVTCIHDPKASIFQLGEVVGPTVLRNTFEFLGIDDVGIGIDGLLRDGVKHYWKKANKDFYVHYNGQKGAHVNAFKFSSYLIEQMELKVPNFKVIHDKIEEIFNKEEAVVLLGEKSIYQFDYVVVCTGWASSEDLLSDRYSLPPYEFTNNVLTYQDEREYNEDNTSIYVHENGWMFGIPLKIRKTFGYVFNNDITNLDDALDNFEENVKHYTDIENFDRSKVRSIAWKQYYRKKAMDNRVLYIGNKLFFFDPSQGLPIHFSFDLITLFARVLSNYRNSPKIMNKMMNIKYRERIARVINITTMAYACKNKIDSEYWKTVSPIAKKILNESQDLHNWYMDAVKKEGKFDDYYPHADRLIKLYIEGFDIDFDEIFDYK